MTGGTTPQFEIPTDMRKMTEQSLEQVKTAINAYLQFFKSNIPDNVMGGSALSDKILSYAERNVASAFEFAQRMAQVKVAFKVTEVLADLILMAPRRTKACG